jgi:hypothetical protein
MKTTLLALALLLPGAPADVLTSKPADEIRNTLAEGTTTRGVMGIALNPTAAACIDRGEKENADDGRTRAEPGIVFRQRMIGGGSGHEFMNIQGHAGRGKEEEGGREGGGEVMRT